MPQDPTEGMEGPDEECPAVPSFWNYIGKFPVQAEMFSRFYDEVREHTQKCRHLGCKELTRAYGRSGDGYFTVDLLQYQIMHPAMVGGASNIEGAIIDQSDWLSAQAKVVSEIGLEEYLRRMTLILKQDFEIRGDIEPPMGLSKQV